MIKTLLIGLGNIGMGYDLDKESDDMLTHAKAIVNTPEMRLVGAVESDSEKGISLRYAMNWKHIKKLEKQLRKQILY